MESEITDTFVQDYIGCVGFGKGKLLMTVLELRNKLQEMPPDAVVVVRGYEQGVDKILDVAECRIEKCKNPQQWDGSHKIVDTGDIQAVYIKSDCGEQYLGEHLETFSDD